MPFGEKLSFTGTDDDANHFANLDHDTSSDTQHAQFRQYSSTQGRWMSPDPYSGSYSPGNPQSFNRYAYVLNNPLRFVDPFGLANCNPQDPGCGPNGQPLCNPTCTDQNGNTYTPTQKGGISGGSGGTAGVDGGGGGLGFGPGGTLGGGYFGASGPSGGPGGTSNSNPATSKPTVPSCSSQNLATRTLSRTAAFTHRGLFIGGSLSGSFEPVSVGATVGYYADPSGTVNRVQTYAFSGALGAGVSGGLTFGVSNYKNGGYAGWSDEFNASAGWGPNASATWSRNSDGSGVSLTLGGGAGLSVGGGRSYTVLTPVCKVGG